MKKQRIRADIGTFEPPIGWYRASDTRETLRTSWLLYPFFTPGAVTAAFGQQKSAAKTTIILSLLTQRGQYFLEHKIDRSPVVYLTEQTKEVFDVSLAAAGAKQLDDLFFTSAIGDLYAEPWDERIERLEEMVQEVGARFVVVDTFIGCTTLDDSQVNNADAAVRRAIGALQRVATRQNAGVVVLHHTPKDTSFNGNMYDAAKGSTSITSSVDICAHIYNPAGDDLKHPRRWVKVGGRFEAPDPFELSYQPDQRRYEYNRDLRKKRDVTTGKEYWA